jgi:phosphoribosyl 1,2-cyclic phosphate phosphodiesterase
VNLKFLGTSASGGFPNPHCRCENCLKARAAGGKSIRMMCSALIDEDLLIDLGPDVGSACARFDIDLASVHWVLQTHSHGDHLMPLHATARAASWAAKNAEPMTWFMNSHAINQIVEGNSKSVPKMDVVIDGDAPARLRLKTISPWQELEFGPYRVLTIPANHGSAPDPMLFAIERAGRRVLYGSDTSCLPADVWPQVADRGWTFDVVVFDHNDGFTRSQSPTHMGSEAVLTEFARMRSLGLAGDATRLFGTHIAHHSNGVHEDESLRARALGYDIAYDGLVVSV